MYETLFILGIIFAVLAGALLITTIVMFFGFNIPALRKDISGALEQKQIEDIRKGSSSAGRRSGVNVFEELEKKAKVKTNTGSLNIGQTMERDRKSNSDSGTSVLRKNKKPVNPNFIVEKDIVFVSTDEIIL